MDERLEAVRRRKRVVLLLVFLGIIGVLIFLLRAVLAPFLIALFVAYLIDPLVGRMAQLRLPKGAHLGRAGSIVVIYLVLISCLILGAKFTIPALSAQIDQVREDLPKARTWLEGLAQDAVGWWEREVKKERAQAKEREEGKADGEEKPPDGEKGEERGPGDEEGLGEEKEPAEPPAPPPTASRYRVELKGGGELTGVLVAESDAQVVLRLGSEFLTVDRGRIERMESLEREDVRFNLLRYIQGLSVHVDAALGVAFNAARALVKALYLTVLVLMITAFLCIDKPRLLAFVSSVPPDRHRETWLRLAGYLDRGLAGVIRGQLMICLVNSILTWIGLQFLGVRYSLLLGVVAGLFSIIPIFGTILSSIPIVLIAWGTSGLERGVLTLGWILFIHFVEANFLNPKIMGSASKIHPVVVIFALIAGENAYGIAGALLAVPAASILQSCFRFFVLDRQLETAEDAA
ncbi:MAG TPA: AI-2E family transporter [Planctomycetota bacterium]|nr:AI-2E family transporter [Planctomycetota bacterium]